MTVQYTDLEANLFLDVIVAHMAFLEAPDVETRSESHRSFVAAIKVLYEFLCNAESESSVARMS